MQSLSDLSPLFIGYTKLMTVICKSVVHSIHLVVVLLYAFFCWVDISYLQLKLG